MEPLWETEFSLGIVFTMMPIYMLSLCRVLRCASTTIHQSAAQVCREKVIRISSCISEVHFHSHAAFQRGSRGPLWQLGIPAGVEIKRGPKNRPGSWEQSTGGGGLEAGAVRGGFNVQLGMQVRGWRLTNGTTAASARGSSNEGRTAGLQLHFRSDQT